MPINPIFAEERQNKILEMLNTNGGNLLVNDLCKIFSVSPATIRNDLNQLERRGLLKRTHGGAIPCNKIGAEQTSIQKLNTNLEQKQRIAEIAASLIENGDTVAIDTGTTTYLLAERLSEKQGVTVITTDLHIAAMLENFPGISVVLPGGSLRKGFSCTVGAITNRILSTLRVDKVFMATNAVDADGLLSTPDIEQAQVKSSLMQMGRQVFLLCDSSKFGRQSFAGFGSLAEIDVIVTDSALEKNVSESLSLPHTEWILA